MAEQVCAIFSGPDGYVSPSYYASKAEHGRVVPTWNYQRVEVRGRVSIEQDPANMLRYVEAATNALEAGRETPWQTTDAPKNISAHYCAALSVYALMLAAFLAPTNSHKTNPTPTARAW